MKTLTTIAVLVIAVNFFISSISTAETSVTVNLRSSVNEISDKFISYNIDFYKLMDAAEKHRHPLTILSPSYVKLENFLEYMKDDRNDERIKDVISIFQSFDRNNIIPVIVIDYKISNFEPLALLESMKIVNSLNINECIWQLGNPKSMQFTSSKSMQKYNDDLKTVKILCESVKRDSKSNWKVAAAVIQEPASSNENNFSLVGLDFGEILQSDILSTLSSSSSSPVVASLDRKALTTKIPVWATIKLSEISSFINHNNDRKGQGSCDENCLIDGLLYANILGEAAKKGIDVLFFERNLNRHVSSNDNILKQAVNNIHNSLIGAKVFNVRMPKSSKIDQKQSSVYAYCSKKINGGVTLMGINYSNTRAKINSKLMTSTMEKNSVVSQYLLSVADGYVMLNNEQYNGTLTAAHKFKKISNRSVDLSIPPFSIVFWVIRNANVKECLNIESNHVRPLTNPSSFSTSPSISSLTSSSSSDKLLKTLVANAINDKEKSGRVKRQFNGRTPFSPRLDFKIADLMSPTNLNQLQSKTIMDVLWNKNTELYKVAPSLHDKNPLESRENVNLPSGDVYLLVNDGKSDYIDADIDYYTQIPPRKNSFKTKIRKPSKKVMSDDSYIAASEAHERFMSYSDAETANPQIKKSSKSPQQQQPQEVGELFEKEIPTHIYETNDQQMRGSSKNVEIKTVMRELEPTIRQSKKALLAAKKKFSDDQLIELLKDATLEEVNRSQFKNADDFEVIDLTNIKEDELPDYAEYDDDEDGFFGGGDNNKKVRSKRAIIDYSKNEIPRDGIHYHNDDDDDEYSIENLANLYLLPPRYDSENSKGDVVTKLMTSTSPLTTTSTETPSNDSSSLGIKIIDIFSKSADDIAHVIHKNIRSMWNVFDSASSAYYS